MEWLEYRVGTEMGNLNSDQVHWRPSLVEIDSRAECVIERNPLILVKIAVIE